MSRKSAHARQNAVTQSTSGTRNRIITQTQPAARTQVAVQTRLRTSEKRNHNVETPKARGGLFTTWLVLMLVVNTAALCLSGISLITSLSIHQPFSIYGPVLADLPVGILAVISTIGIFRWKKWGFFLFLGAACCGFLLDIVLGQTVVVSHIVTLGPTSRSITNIQVYITWPLTAGLMWLLAHSKKRWPMFE